MKKLRKIVKYLIGIFIALFLLSLAFIFIIVQYRQEIKKADAILVLGAAINTPALYNRSIQGLKLYQQGKADFLILSGGRISDKYISEAGYMQKVISKNAGMPIKMILEEESHSTFENIKNSKAKAPQAKSVIIVSDKFHLARAFLLAKRQGFSPVYWSAPEGRYYNFKESVYYYLREAVAMMAYIPRFLLN
jgi:uncharacterized SAM-binding protein YcdF (DUF218 family)